MTRNDCKKNRKLFDPHSLSLVINCTTQAHYLEWQIKVSSKHPYPPPSTFCCYHVQFDAAILADKASAAVVILSPSNKITWMASTILPLCSPLKAEADAALLVVETILLLEIFEVILEGDSATVIGDLSYPLFPSD